MKKIRTLRRKNAFTLIEMIIVMSILALLASTVTPMYLNYIKKANISAAKTQIKVLEEALTAYRLDVGSYPDGESGLKALLENVSQNEKWDGPYIQPAVPKDPWGNDYVYTCPGEHGAFDLVSYGADGQPGGTGENADLANYVLEQ
ncbi:MAG: type II secretion system major pseudopilin GspG [Victivallaceae bacterium]|nr:type II secretion system major pseudopilin GspG [Victivallaceae bacterium]